MRNKYILYVLLVALMIYFAIDKININSEGLAGIFAIVWLTFALFAFAGNLASLLFAPRKKELKKINKQTSKKDRQIHSYY